MIKNKICRDQNIEYAKIHFPWKRNFKLIAVDKYGIKSDIV